MTKHLNFRKYTWDQIVDALTCPLNRHATRCEHNCDDWELHKHPEWLIDHYIKHGGADYWATKREQYMEEDNAEEAFEEAQAKDGGDSKASQDVPAP